MVNIQRLILPFRLVNFLGKHTHLIVYRKFDIFLPALGLNSTLNHSINITRNMSQKSITAFFSKAPRKTIEKKDTNGLKEQNSKGPEVANTEEIIKKLNENNEKKSTKRQRIDSSSSEKSDTSPSKSPVTASEKKKSKRSRIISTSSEESPKKENVSQVVKTEKVTPKKKSSLKNKNSVKEETKVKKASTTTIKEETPQIEDRINKDEEKEADLLPRVKEEDYDPSKSKYHPVFDACWARGEKVPYLALAKTLEAIEAITARLKIIEILSNYLRSVIVLTPEDLLPSIYLCLNLLAPAYHGLELGVAETYLMKAIGQGTGRSLAQMKAAVAAAGDLGQVAQTARATQRMLVQPQPLKLRSVFSSLKEIAMITGQASVNKKIAKIQSLYVACRHSEAKYLIRGLSGKLRVGLAEQSVLQALAVAVASTPPQPWPPEQLDVASTMHPEAFKSRVDEYALIIKTTYCECPNYELLVPVLLEHGVAALPEHCRLTPGIPLKPMLAHPSKGVQEVFHRFDNLEFTCEWKYDGERAQIHIPSKDDAPDLSSATIYSRNQENNTSKYPDILKRLGSLLKPDVKSCVLDCEAVAFDTENKQILPFQVLSTRKRKDASAADIKVQVCVFVFDLLYLNEKPLVTKPLMERRDLLRNNFNEVTGEWQFATSRDCNSMEAVAEFLDEAVRGSCEGLMVKTLNGKDATYEIARRSHNWLKLKKDYLDGVGDTMDLVVIGGYHGAGRRAGVYGGFLLACYHPDLEEYQSLCKIGTGFSDEDLKTLTTTLNEHKEDGPKSYYRYDNSHAADTWFSPHLVVEVRCADLSLSPAHRAAIGLLNPDKGISLRFPRFIRVRDDKGPEQATTAQQIADMYMSQDQVKNQAPKINVEEDFY